MFESTWCAVLAACSAVMDGVVTDATPAVVTTSLRGFSNSVHIASEFGMSTERDAFVTMLAKYTYLESMRAMSWRNIESFTTLVHIALTDGNGLGHSWAQILKCLSEFQRLHMIGTGAKTDAQLFFPDNPTAPTPSKPIVASSSKALSSSTSTRISVIIQPTRPRQSKESHSKSDAHLVDEQNSVSLVDKVDVVAIDRIFSSSATLGPEAIVHFVSTLCAVSREELSSPTDPQIYSLQKLVEIAYYNMSRVRMVWSRIWEVLGDFFTEVGQHPNPSIAMYAVDSLRQLSTKFLEKGELLKFSFQQDFLKPFVDLMGVATSLEIKELILGCLDHMVQSRAKSIRSGWRPMFAVFGLAAADDAKPVAKSGYSLTLRVIEQHFSLIGEHHPECAACLAAYVGSAHEDVSLQASTALVEYSKRLQLEGNSSSSAPSDAQQATPDVSDSSTHGGGGGVSVASSYESILGALMASVTDRRPNVRAAAMQALFAILTAQLSPDGALHGELGRSAFKSFVLGLFDERVPPETDASTGAPSSAPNTEDIAWLGSTGLSALAAAERCFCSAYDVLGSGLLDQLVALLVRCLQQKHTPSLAHVAAEALLHLVKETGASFNQDTWASVCTELRSCFDGSVEVPTPPPQVVAATGAPSGVVEAVSQRVQKEAPPGSGPQATGPIIITVYQLLNINHPLMKLVDVEGLLNCLHASYEKSHRTLTDALEGTVEVSSAELEEALALELESMAYYLQILFAFFQKLEPGAKLPSKGEVPPLGSPGHLLLIGAAAEYRLVSFCLHVLREYLSVNDAAMGSGATARLATKLLAALTPSIVTLMQGLLAFHEPQFVRHLPGFYPLFVDLMHCDSKELRQILREIFSQRIGTVLQERQAA